MKKINFEIGVGIVGIAMLLGACAIWGAPWTWFVAQKEAEETPLKEPPTQVTISEEKYESMKLRCVPVERRAIQPERAVWGKIEYRRIHRVELKAPVDSVVQQVLVKPGDAVRPGTPLARLTSAEIALARADLEKARYELEIANKALGWAEEITQNLDDLLAHLRDKPNPSAVEEEYQEKLLGDHRQQIFPAYSNYVLAEQIWELSRRGKSLPEKTLRERESAHRVAKEKYLAECEQSNFDAWQAREKARQSRTWALQLVDVSRQKLQTLLGAYGRTEDLVAKEGKPGNTSPEQGAELTSFYLVAPFEGTVEQRLAADAQRVAEGTLLFAVANTKTLEVTANIREGDWRAVAPYLLDELADVLKVRVPSVSNDREFPAQVDYVGRAVDPATQAVPLVALLENSGHEFRPGMMAMITLPAGAAEEQLVVPAAAVRTHDQQPFVFVETEPRTFRRVDVKIGREVDDWVTIAEGLSLGQRVVADGSFLLKNEMLLPFIKAQEE